MEAMLIDLHAHSTASDGTDSPAELTAAAAAAGLGVVAITDHDTTLGWEPALSGRPADLWVICGAEFSTVAGTEGQAPGGTTAPRNGDGAQDDQQRNPHLRRAGDADR